MNESMVLGLIQQTIQVMLLVAAPTLLAGLAVGLFVSIAQVVTSIQDSTLSLLPRIVAMIVAAYLALPFMLRSLTSFTITLYEFIPSVVR